MPNIRICLTNNAKQTVLHSACLSGWEDIVRLLLIKKPHLIDMRDQKGFCPLQTAVFSGHDKVVSLLLKKRGDQNDGEKDKVCLIFIRHFFILLSYNVIMRLLRPLWHSPVF